MMLATIVDLALLAWAIWTLKADLSNAQSWIIFAIIVINFIWQICNAFGHFFTTFRSVNFKSKKIVEKGGSFKLKADVINTYIYIEEPELKSLCIVPKNLDDFLSNDIWAITEDSNAKPRNVETLVHDMWPINFIFLNEKIHSGENFFNEDKLCMTSEMFKDKKNTWNVRVCKGNYYNHYLSNAIFNYCLDDKNNGMKIWPPINAMTYEIPKLEDSMLSNHIGVSSLLISSDGRTVLLVQNAKAAHNKNKIVPTCSGSVDYADRPGHDNLRDVIIAAAERELLEETTLDVNKLPADIKVETKIIGFYRDLSRGGKPEFCCVTEVDEVREALVINPQTKEQQKEVYASPKIEMLVAKGVAINDDNKENVSLSLKANIYFLKKYLEKQKLQ